MSIKTYRIDLLCKIVDNFGDAGLAWRLVRALADAFVKKFKSQARLELRLICNELEILQKLGAKNLIADSYSLMMFDWNKADTRFRDDPADFVIETFGCNYPDWYTDIIFDINLDRPRKLVNLEYLTAETWAEDYHLLPSLSPIERLKKTFFMPGFRPGLGGLIFDREYRRVQSYWQSLDRAGIADARRDLLERCGAELSSVKSDGQDQAKPYASFWISIFSYEHNYGAFLAELVSWKQPVVVILAAGQASQSFLAALGAASEIAAEAMSHIHCLSLPFVQQEVFDELVLACDFNLVRGEESMSRAALSGKPFLWHCYALEQDDHLDKVTALIDELAKQCTELDEAMAWYRCLMIDFNRRKLGPEKLENYTGFQKHYHSLVPVFKTFSQNLLENGDCATKLVDFLWN